MVEPRRQVAAIAGLAVTLLLAILFALSVFTDASVEPWMYIVVAVIGGALVVVLAMIEKTAVRAGPWIVVQDDTVFLPRAGRSFGLPDCLGWDVVCQREVTAMGELWIAYLAIVTADHQAHIVLGSMYHKHVKKLKGALAEATGLPILQDCKGAEGGKWGSDRE